MTESSAIIVLVCVCFCVHMGGLWLLVALHFPNHQHLSLIRLHQLCMQAAQGSRLYTAVPCPRAFFSLLIFRRVSSALFFLSTRWSKPSQVEPPQNGLYKSCCCDDERSCGVTEMYWYNVWCCIFSSSDCLVDGKIWNARWDVCSIFWISCMYPFSEAGMMAWEDEQFKDWKKSIIEVNISLLLKSTYVQILVQLAN